MAPNLRCDPTQVDIEARNFFEASKEVLSSSEDQQLEEALKRIRILDGPSTTTASDDDDDDDDDDDFLKLHHGELYEVPNDILNQIQLQAPTQLSATVADFNENLSFEFQSQETLVNLGLTQFVTETLKARQFVGSYLQTDQTTIPQPAHVDYTWEVLEEHPQLYLAFFPLTNAGMYLQVWKRQEKKQDDTEDVRIFGDLVYIPRGRLLVLPANTIHAGGFRTHLEGNLRFHLYLARGQDSLPIHQTNKYTEPHDRRRELSERYVDTSMMKVLQEHYFV